VGEALERRLTSVAVVVVYLTAGPQAARSSDGAEMLALTRHWAGTGPVVDGSFWTPLWSALLVPFAHLGDLERSAWMLNLALAGAVAWPLWLLTARLGGVWAARAAVFFWALAPFAWFDGAVLDQRPLFWFLGTSAVALAVDAHHGGRAWWPAFALGALAPLARPEGLAVVPLIAFGALVMGNGWRRILPLAAGALTPAVVDQALRAGGRGTWGSFWIPWADSWPMSDFLALYGVASGATEFRGHVIAQLEAGLEEPVSGVHVLSTAPEVVFVAQGLTECLGTVLMAALLIAVPVQARSAASPLRAALVMASAAGPLLVVSLTPGVREQITAHTNVSFMAPYLLAVVMAGAALLARDLGRRQAESAIPVGLALVALLDVHYGPVVAEAPRFLEDSPAALAMAAHLESESGAIACTYSARGVARRANREVLTLGSTWEPLPEADAALVTQADVDLGENAVRVLELLESPEWSTAYVTGDTEFIYLKRVSE